MKELNFSQDINHSPIQNLIKSGEVSKKPEEKLFFQTPVEKDVGEKNKVSTNKPYSA